MEVIVPALHLYYLVWSRLAPYVFSFSCNEEAKPVFFLFPVELAENIDQRYAVKIEGVFHTEENIFQFSCVQLVKTRGEHFFQKNTSSLTK